MAHQLISRLDESWLEWLRVLDEIQPCDRDSASVCGPWTVKDLVGHMALWDREVLTDIGRWQLGLPYLSNNWQQMNDDSHARKRDIPFDLLRVEMYSAHQAVRSALREIPDDLAGEILERIAVDTWDHYPEHTGQLQAWINSKAIRFVEEPDEA